MQGRNENILTSSDKILALKDKLKLWKTNINKNNIYMFPRLANFAEDNVLPAAVQKLILTHLEHLQTKIDLYFADIDVASYDWIRNSYSPHVTENVH